MASHVRRHYSDEEIAAALAYLDANGRNYARTARETKVPRSTLQSWDKGRNVNPVPAELRHEKRLDLRSILQDELIAVFAAMPDKRGEADYKTLATAAGILADKFILLEGGVTSRVDVNVRNLPDLPDGTLAGILTD